MSGPILRLGNDSLCDSVETRNFWLHRTETNRLSFMRLCYKLGIAAVFLLLPCVSAYPASTRNKIDPDPVIGLMRPEAPRCAVVCGINCIRPWAPFNDTGFSMPYDGGLLQCLRLRPVTPHPSGATRQAAVAGCYRVERCVCPRCFETPVEITLRHARRNHP